MKIEKISKAKEVVLRLEGVGLIREDVTDSDIRKANVELRKVSALTGLKRDAPYKFSP